MKKTMLIAVVIAAVMCVSPVWSQGGPGGHGGPGGPGGPGAGMAVPPPPPAAMLDNIASTLSLTEDQTASLKTVLTASDAKLQPLMKAAADAGKALNDAVFATTYDFAAVADLVSAALTAQGNVMSATIDAWAQIRAILTADQLAALQACSGPGCPPPSGSGGGSSTTQRRR